MIATIYLQATYATGYQLAASWLYYDALDHHLSPDVIVFPLAFLWRHHLELALKGIIAKGTQINGKPWHMPHGHDLMKLWREAKPYIESIAEGKRAELANVEANLAEFTAIDPGADGFRYPLTRERTRSIPTAPKLVNLELLNDGMAALSNFLDAVDTEMSMRLDYVVEAMAAERDL